MALRRVVLIWHVSVRTSHVQMVPPARICSPATSVTVPTPCSLGKDVAKVLIYKLL